MNTSQEHFLVHDGRLLDAGSPLVNADNRAFRYGDGLFETMRVVDGQVPLWEFHMDRLFQGLSILKFHQPAWLMRTFFLEQVLQLVKKNKQGSASRVRLQAFRGDGGLFDQQEQTTHFVIQSTAIDRIPQLNEKGYVTGIHPDVRKSCDVYAQIKSCNYLPYIQAAIHAGTNKWNECFVLNTYGRICDAAIANVFWIKGSEVFTPPLAEGGVAGVMRRYLLEQLPLQQVAVSEKSLDSGMLLDADEVFLTNAVMGMRWVGQFLEKTYQHRLTKEIFRLCLANS